MSGAWANCSPTSSLLLLGLNRADEGLRANDRSLILSRRGGPGVVSERGACAPSPVSGGLPCYVPVLVLGGPKTYSDQEFLAFIRGALDAGAAGVVLGRNVWQSAV